MEIAHTIISWIELAQQWIQSDQSCMTRLSMIIFQIEYYQSYEKNVTDYKILLSRQDYKCWKK